MGQVCCELLGALATVQQISRQRRCYEILSADDGLDTVHDFGHGAFFQDVPFRAPIHGFVEEVFFAVERQKDDGDGQAQPLEFALGFPGCLFFVDRQQSKPKTGKQVGIISSCTSILGQVNSK